MKILLFGHYGWIGKQFLDFLIKNDVEVITTKIRADDEKMVENEITTTNPSHIVSFIGRTHGESINTVDYLEQPGKLKENIRDNLYGPLVLSILCKKYNIHYTYLGTGCIFNDIDPSAISHSENESPNFYGSSYSIVKGFTDRLQHMFEENTLNLRIRMPITDFDHPRNFISKIIGYKKICSMSNSMTVLHDMYPIIYDLLKNNKTGTFNMVNKGIISHNEILNMYKEIVDPTLEWTNISLTEQDKILLSQRSNCQLDHNKLYELYPNIPEIHVSVRNCIHKLKNT
jgi:dTDP-4-dehydrorhamnose reductase